MVLFTKLRFVNGEESYAHPTSKRKLVELDKNEYTNIFGRVRCGDLEMAWRTFDKMPKKSVVSWNTMISGLAYNGQGKLGLEMFERMSVDPNDATFAGALACCAHTGMVPKVLELLFFMTEKYKIKPRLEYYGCMVDLLGRLGCVKRRLELIKGMPMMQNAAIWGAPLSVLAESTWTSRTCEQHAKN
ncbi:hypothetical protein IFM89_015317 [Coptis chinensis]|uniref:Pentatricopeptide repeat-containing protein n=1 Tax=Coptis chinensis TaxID=261450 RepID=A0A835M6D4_9MAGN|nr:hypothetical protein IFM89_015317 [Coptis chinensis]